MRTKETIRAEIVVLMRELARTGMALRMEKRINRQIELMHARTEIYKSIAHRQGLMIEMMTNELAFAQPEGKVA